MTIKQTFEIEKKLETYLRQVITLFNAGFIALMHF